MHEQLIDARGKPCPQPVLLTRDALQKAAGQATLRVIVDNPASCENVTRMARSLGCRARIDRQLEGEIHLLIEPAAAQAPEAQAEETFCGVASRNVVLVSSAGFGEGDAELGAVLMRAFVKTLKEVTPQPVAMFFINSGVRLTTEGSSLLDDIAELERRGMEIFSCGTCLDFFGLQDKLKVGKVTNMFEVVSQLSAADRVIRP